MTQTTPEQADRRNVAAVLSAVGDIRIEERPVPAMAADEVLVQVESVGICGSDVHYYRHGRIGSYVVDAPLVLGHETAGIVVDLGASVKGLSVGDRVAIEPGVPCGRCELCRRGHYNLCSSVVFHGTPPVDGALQRYVAIRSDFVFRLPAAVPIEHGSLVEPLAVAVWACRKAAVAPGSSVLVTGAGPVGLLAIQVARAFGADAVAATDLDEEKRRMALSLGADRVARPDELEASSEAEFDIHIECSGSASASRSGILRLKPLGTSVLVGMGVDDVAVPVSAVQERELSITGIFRYANCYPTAIALLASGRIRVDELISARYRLEETAQALERGGQDGVLKNLVLPGT